MRPALLCAIIGCLAAASAQEPEGSLFRLPAWSRVADSDMPAVETLCTDYKAFLRNAQHELRAVAESERRARARNFRPLDEFDRLQPGDRFFVNNKGRSMVLGIVGEAPLDEGSTLSAAHIDSVRIELKANPIYEREQFAMFQTTYHGNIRNFQWTNIPLGLVGRINTLDGRVIDIAFGIESEPYLVIAALAPHVDKDFRTKNALEYIEGEDLDPIVGSRPDDLGSVEDPVLALLKQLYNIAPEDFVSAQLALVPAMPPADVGFDRALIGAFAHDDLLCSYASLKALLDFEGVPPQTALVYLAANAESGSNNVMGAQSPTLYDALLSVLEKRTGEEASFSDYRRAVRGVFALSADTPTGMDPVHPGVQEETNAARLGAGVVIKRYGKGNDPVTEAMVKLRVLLETNGIPWQTSTYKVDVGGGGTLGGFLSDDGIDTIDVGAPILSMHSPWPIASKADIWWQYKLYSALFATELGTLAR